MSLRTAPPGALAALCLLWAGCIDGHPYSELDRTRLLGVRADLPELGPGETATLDALVYPTEDAPVSHTWGWCPWTEGSNTGFACLVDQAEVDSWGLPLPPLDLGTEPTASFPYPDSAEVVQGLCEGFLQGIPPASRKNFPDCTSRMPITVTLTVRSGDTEIEAVKELDLLVDPELAPNRNPGLVELAAAERTVEDGTAFEPDTDYDLTVTLVPGSDETYASTDERGDPKQRTELLTLTWLWSGGSAEYGRTGSVDDGQQLAAALENTWTSPAESGDVDLIVVLRDDRGGIDWLERSVRVGAP